MPILLLPAYAVPCTWHESAALLWIDSWNEITHASSLSAARSARLENQPSQRMQVYVGPPSREGRAEVLEVHLKKFQWNPETVDVHDLAFSTDGYTGAMLSNLCNLAALMASREGRTVIEKEDFRVALQYEQQGLPAGQHGPKLTRRIAIVEGATAVAATLMPSIEPVERVYTQPTEKRRTGQTVLHDSEQRIMTELFTKQYLRVR
jgi:ATP-dependent Zn protease